MFRLARFAPTSDVARFVENYWVVTWDLCGQKPHAQEILPDPCINVAFEAGRSVVVGVSRGKATREIAGAGRAVGIKFRPGAFHPFLRGSVAKLTGRALPLRDVFGPSADKYERRILACTTDARAARCAESFVRDHLPLADATTHALQEIIAEISRNRELTRVAQLEAFAKMSERSLQRLFSQRVGVSPKWVIRLHRLQEAAAYLGQGNRVSWSRLAQDLGYFDQAHLINDFTKVVGMSPATYARADATTPSD